MNFSSVSGNGVIDLPDERDAGLPTYAGVSAKICKGCQRMKTLSAFQTHHATADGYLDTCKECMGKRIKKAQAGKNEVTTASSLFRAAVKQCSHCKKSKSLDLFGKNKNSPDGYSWWCKECTNAPRVAARDKKRATEEVVIQEEAVTVGPAPEPKCPHRWFVGEAAIEMEWPNFYTTHERPPISSGDQHQKCVLCGEEGLLSESFKLKAPKPKVHANGTGLLPKSAPSFEEYVDYLESAGVDLELVELEVSSMGDTASTNGHENGAILEAGGGEVTMLVETDPATGASKVVDWDTETSEVEPDLPSWAASYQELKGQYWDLERHAQDLKWELDQANERVRVANTRAEVAELDLEIYKLQQKREKLWNMLPVVV